MKYQVGNLETDYRLHYSQIDMMPREHGWPPLAGSPKSRLPKSHLPTLTRSQIHCCDRDAPGNGLNAGATYGGRLRRWLTVLIALDGGDPISRALKLTWPTIKSTYKSPSVLIP